MGWKARLASGIIILSVFMVTVVDSPAQAATVSSVNYTASTNSLTVNWTLSPSDCVHSISISRSASVNSTGYFTGAYDTYSPGSGSCGSNLSTTIDNLSGELSYSPGTYYVQVQYSNPNSAAAAYGGGYGSNVLSFTIPGTTPTTATPTTTTPTTTASSTSTTTPIHEPGDVTLSEISGTVEVLQSDGSWVQVTNGAVVHLGQEMRTGPTAKCTVGFDDNSQISLGYNSSFIPTQDTTAVKSSGSIVVDFVSGVLRWTDAGYVKGYFGESTMKSWMRHRPTAVAAVRGTDFVTGINAKAEAITLDVHQGTVTLQAAPGKKTVAITALRHADYGQVWGDHALPPVSKRVGGRYLSCDRCSVLGEPDNYDPCKSDHYDPCRFNHYDPCKFNHNDHCESDKSQHDYNDTTVTSCDKSPSQKARPTLIDQIPSYSPGLSMPSRPRRLRARSYRGIRRRREFANDGTTAMI